MVSPVSNSLLSALQSQGYSVKQIGTNGQGVAQGMSAAGSKNVDIDKAKAAPGMRDGFGIVAGDGAGGDAKLNALLSKLDDKTKASFLKDQEQPDSVSRMLEVLVKAFDVNGDGKFDAGDVEKLKNPGKESSTGASGPTVDGLSNAIASLLKTLDANGDGKIDQTDVNAVKSSGKAGAADRAKLLDSLLKSLDVNSDGKLDSGDLTKLQSGGAAGAKTALKADNVANALADLLKFFDDNKDSKIDKTDVGVFKKQEDAAASAAAKLQARMALMEKLQSSLQSSGTGMRAAKSLASLLSSRHVPSHSTHRFG